MDSIDLIKKLYVDDINRYASMLGKQSPFTSAGGEGQVGSAQLNENVTFPHGPACNTEAIEAYKLNVDADANAWKLLEEIGRKAALVDELFTQLNETHAALVMWTESKYIGTERWEKTRAALEKYEALPK